MHCGTSISVLRKTRYDFTHLPAGNSQVVVLQESIDVRAYYHVQLFVRVHARVFSGAQNFTFNLSNTFPSEEDPREFTATSNVISLTIVGGTGTGVIPVPGIGSASASNPGAFLKLSMIANQDIASPGIFYGEMSAELVLRPS